MTKVLAFLGGFLLWTFMSGIFLMIILFMLLALPYGLIAVLSLIGGPHPFVVLSPLFPTTWYILGFLAVSSGIFCGFFSVSVDQAKNKRHFIPSRNESEPIFNDGKLPDGYRYNKGYLERWEYGAYGGGTDAWVPADRSELD